MFKNQNQEKFLLETLREWFHAEKNHIFCSGLAGASKAYFTASVYEQLGAPIVVIAASTKEAEKFVDDFCFFSPLSAQHVFYFPPYNIMPFKHVSYSNETAAHRIRTLYHLTAAIKPPVMVTTVAAVLQKLIPKQRLCQYAELIQRGEEIERDGFIKKLISGGYSHTAIAEEVGDFSTRGGIIDIFSSNYPYPLRLEMDGDRVDSLRFFSATTQRTVKNIQEAVILPSREVILAETSLAQVIGRIREQSASMDVPVTKARAYIRRIKEEGGFPGIESLTPLIYSEPGVIFDYISDGAIFILVEPGELEKSAANHKLRLESNYQAARKESKICLSPEQSHLDWSMAMEMVEKRRSVSMGMLPVLTGANGDGQCRKNFSFSVTDNTDLVAELNIKNKKENLLIPLAERIKHHGERGLSTLFVCRTASQANRLRILLQPYHIHPEAVEGFSGKGRARGTVHICLGQLSAGFVWPAETVAIITEEEIFGAKHRKRKTSGKELIEHLLSVEDLKKGDLVVHTDHGIGQYEGLAKLKLNGTENDFLLILYRDNDKLYLPVDRMSLVQKYMGIDDAAPMLDKMGGTSWERVKKKVKKSVEKIAGELLKIYAERSVRQGYAFSQPDRYFHDFEAAFPYDETADQIKAINDVIEDLKQPVPMDRLVCGDVGYGKTEVALRASFVVVSSGKQVAVLVPTTVLAEQHFATFTNRFKHYPVQIACLSRFRSYREQREIIEGLKRGKIDIVIGTHRLLQKDVLFQDLGIVILDEEQRFGVRHKERLKKIRSTVDVLALTATPIPRTLHMSLMGMRDISVISTPPEHRHAIITYICEFDDAIISEAIRKELNRDGQLFFVHNNIHTIEAMARHLQELVPEARIGAAHGRMDESELEKVMLKFANRNIDMLVCTTIIESGLDIPSANTILVNRADRFGLAQMYQLRGRVGRSDEQAYAYLFIPGESIMSKDAQKRLKVLMEHSDLGSGFQIAMNDLKIRGGGTILGASQSGHIAAVGYDMYLKLMEHAIADLKGLPAIPDLDPEINFMISAFIPEDYIPDIDQRLLAYRQLAKIRELDGIKEFKLELLDRYGKIPIEVSNLFLKIALKVLCVKAGIKKLDLLGELLVLQFSEPHQKNPAGLVDMIIANTNRFQLTPDYTLRIKLEKKAAGSLWGETKNILKEIIQHVNG